MFWRDLELHRPGIDSLRLPPDVAAEWKQRVLTAAAAGKAQTRITGLDVLVAVRAFYLDIAEWALEDPARWGPWAAPCPLRADELSRKKDQSRRKARMDQRTRERLPVLPALVASADAQRRASRERLEAAAAAEPGQAFTRGGPGTRPRARPPAVMNGMPPHIAQLVAGHRDVNTTMGYKAVYPEEVINGHRAFIARRRATRPGEEYRTPTDEEWDEFLGHFERRKVALGECGRAYSSPCIHEHSCIRCPLLRVEPGQRQRLAGIRDNLTARITEALREGWLGEAEGLKVSLAAAEAKLVQVDGLVARRREAVSLGMPAFPDIAGRTSSSVKEPQ